MGEQGASILSSNPATSSFPLNSEQLQVDEEPHGSDTETAASVSLAMTAWA